MSEHVDPPENPPSPPAPPAPAPPAQPPPAASAVLNGGRTEREADLERELASEREARRLAETRCSEAEDENHRLKNVGAVPPASKKKRAGWTLLHEEENEPEGEA